MPKSKTRKRKHKKSLTKTKFRSPTSLSIFPERSPQLQGDEPSILNKFTTKYISIQNKRGQQWNTVENNKLAYKRSARGAPIGSYPKIIFSAISGHSPAGGTVLSIMTDYRIMSR